MNKTSVGTVAHLTTVDMSLRFLLMPQLEAVADGGAVALGISAPGPWVEELERRGVTHVALESSTRGVDWKADLRAMVELWRILRRWKPDVLHTHNPKPGIYGRIVGRLAGVPVVGNTVHGFYATDDDPWIKRFIVYGLEALASRFSDFELYQNEEDLSLARKLRIVSTAKSALLGNGVDLARFDRTRFADDERSAVRQEWGVGNDTVVVGIVGRLVAEKGYPELFEAMRRLHGDVALVVIGPDDPTKPDALDRQLVERAIEDGVRFLGMRDDVDRLYSGMDIFVLPSHREGFPRAAMEAAATGLPIVATNIRGCRQVVAEGENGILVPVADSASLAAAVQRLVDDVALRRSMGAASRTKAHAEFDERQVVEIVMRVHSQAAATKGLRWQVGAPSRDEVVVEPAQQSDLAAVAWLHQRGIATGFLSTLGVGFLRNLYAFMASDPRSVVLVARDGHGVVGFIAGTTDTSDLYRRFIRTSAAVRAGIAALPRLVRPSSVRRLWETFGYGRRGSETAHTPAELLSMAVADAARGRGLGFLLGEKLLGWCEERGVGEVSVVVGADNQPAINLYRRLGFGSETTFEVHRGDPSLLMTWRP